MENNLEKEIKALKEEVEKQNSLLVEQEHRFLRVLHNFFIKRKKWPVGDKRRVASSKALLYSIFFSPTTVALTGGAVAVFSLFILYWQTTAIVDQNDLLYEQIKLQDEQFDNRRLTELTIVLYDSVQNPGNSRLKSEAIVEYVNLKRKRDPNAEINLSNVQLQGIDISNVNFDKINFYQANFSGATMTGVSFHESILSEASFISTDLEFCDFEDANLQFAEFGVPPYHTNRIKDSPFLEYDGASGLGNCSFQHAHMYHVEFYEATLSECDFLGAYINGTNFDEAELSHNLNLTNDQFSYTLGVPFIYGMKNVFVDSLLTESGYCRTIYYDKDPNYTLDTCISKSNYEEMFGLNVDPVFKD